MILKNISGKFITEKMKKEYSKKNEDFFIEFAKTIRPVRRNNDGKGSKHRYL